MKGIILGAIIPPSENFEIEWSKYSVVKIDSRFVEPQETVVTNDQQHAVRMAYRNLAKNGYRRIALVIGMIDDINTNGLHKGGYHIASQQANSVELPILYLDHTVPTEAIAATIAHWVKENQPEVIISNWGYIPEFLAMNGITVPSQIAFCSICLDQPNSEIAGVIQNHKDVGSRAVATLATQLRIRSSDRTEDNSLIYVRGTWNDGKSAPKKN